VICLLALCLRIGLTAHFVGLSTPPDAAAHPDQVDYERLTERLTAGLGYTREDGTPTAFRAPGTALTLAPAYLVAGPDRAAGRIWFALLSAATCGLSGLLAARAFGPRAGLATATLLALHPGHAYYSLHFLSETPFAFWLTLAALLMDVHLRGTGSRIAATASGLALGLAVLTRPQALLILPLAVPLGLWYRGRLSPPRRTGLALAGLGVLLVVGGWVGRNQVQLGHPVLSTVGGCTFWGAHNERIATEPAHAGSWVEVTALGASPALFEGPEVEVDRRCWEQGREYLSQDPGQLPRLLAWKLVRLVEPFPFSSNPLLDLAVGAAWLVHLPLLLLGLTLLRRRDGLLFWTVVLPLLALLLTTLIFYGSARFRQGHAGLLIVPVGLAATVLVERLRGRRDARPPRLESELQPPAP
jgi:4-amino-4-deoxy-L-arabinose transferase-like glycosyltransferase